MGYHTGEDSGVRVLTEATELFLQHLASSLSLTHNSFSHFSAHVGYHTAEDSGVRVLTEATELFL